MSRPRVICSFHRSTTASASARAALSAASRFAPALISSPRVRTPMRHRPAHSSSGGSLASRCGQFRRTIPCTSQSWPSRRPLPRAAGGSCPAGDRAGIPCSANLRGTDSATFWQFPTGLTIRTSTHALNQADGRSHEPARPHFSALFSQFCISAGTGVGFHGCVLIEFCRCVPRLQ
jgi:hypothetical protein